jgi:hypothetical protein
MRFCIIVNKSGCRVSRAASKKDSTTKARRHEGTKHTKQSRRRKSSFFVTFVVFVIFVFFLINLTFCDAAVQASVVGRISYPPLSATVGKGGG